MREKKARRKATGRLIDVWVFGLTVVPSARTHLVSGAAKKGVEVVVVKLEEGQVGGVVVRGQFAHPAHLLHGHRPCAFAVDVRFLLAAAWCPTPHLCLCLLGRSSQMEQQRSFDEGRSASRRDCLLCPQTQGCSANQIA